MHIVFQVMNFISNPENEKYQLIPIDRLLLLMLAKHSGPDGIFPSVNTLAKELYITPTYLKDRINLLDEKKIIKIDRKMGCKHYYHLIFLVENNSDEIITGQLQLTGSTPSTGQLQLTGQSITGQLQSRQPVNCSLFDSIYNQYTISVKNEPFLKSKGSTKNEQSLFDHFWEVYPRKQNKAKAQKTWKNKKLDAKSEMIITDVKNRILIDHQWKDPQYIPMPTTYLNGERWNDEIIKPKDEKISNYSYSKQEIKCTVPFRATDQSPPIEKIKTEEEKRVDKEMADQAREKMRKTLNLRR